MKDPIIKHRSIEIRQVNGGVIASVGCETFVFTSKQELVDAFSIYVLSPEEAEDKYTGRNAANKVKGALKELRAEEMEYVGEDITKSERG